MKKTEKSYAGWYFLLTVAILYVIIGLLKIEVILPALKFSLKVVKNIIPVFLVIFALMAAFNFFISPYAVRKYLGKSSGFTRWLIAVEGGIISTGPIYMWYPTYFGWKYTVVLAVVMATISVIQGIIFERIEGGGFL